MKHIFHMDTRQVHSPENSSLKGQGPSKKKRRASVSFFQKTAVLWRVLLYVILGVCTLVLLCFLAFFCYVKMYPQQISQEISESLHTHAQMEVEFSSIDVALLPLPALSFADVQLQHDDFSLTVAYATVEPSLWALVQGKLSLGDISLWRPVFTWKSSLAASETHAAIKEEGKTEALTPQSLVTPVASPPPANLSSANLPPSSDDAAVQKGLEQHVGALLHAGIQNAVMQIPSFVYGSSLEILHGKVLVEHGAWHLQCENVNTALRLGALGALGGVLSFEDGVALLEQKPVAQLQRFSLNLSGAVDASIQVRVQSQGQWTGVLDKARVDITTSYSMEQGVSRAVSVISKALPEVLSHSLSRSSWLAKQEGEGPLQAQWDIQGDVLWHDEPIAVQSKGRLWGDFQKNIYLQDIKVRLEQDSLTLQGILALADVQNPTLSGSIHVSQLSLTQWFGFARHMPAGLQHTLHNLQGELDFVLNKEGLEVPRINAHAAEAHFTGKGAVPDWSNAVVVLDIVTPELYLRNAYPEAEGIHPEPLAFRHKPLTPVPGTPEAAAAVGGVSVSYDINVAAKQVYAWELPVGDLKFRACAIELDRKQVAKKHKNAAVLSVSTPKFFGGRAEAKGILYRSADDVSAYDITAILRNVRAEKPVARIIGQELIGGRMSADASVTAKGIYAGEFLTSLAGSASLRVDNGNFYSRSKRKVPFKVMTLAGTVAGLNPEKVSGSTWPSKLQYSGQWRATLDTDDIRAKSTWNGALEFVGKDYGTVALNKVPGSFQISFAPDLTTLPHAVDVEGTGEISLDTTKGVVSLAKGKGTLPSLAGMHVSGYGSLNFSRDITWTAQVQSASKSITALLQRLDSAGESLLPKTAPQSATLATSLAYAKNTLRMDKIQFKLDTTHITGKMQRTFDAKPTWSFDLHATEFDFDKLIRGRKAGEKPAQSSSAAGTAGAQKALSWQWLQDLRAKGTLRVDTYHMNHIRVKNVHVPVSIQNGSLDCTPTKAEFYGGSAVINFKSKVQKGALHTQLGVVAKKANLLALSHDLKLETAIAGNADLWLSAQGDIRYTKDIPAAFDGSWRLQVGSGFLQSREDDGRLVGSPTNFVTFGDTGVITKGILESHKFLLQGADMYVTGKGHIDLMKDSLDMHLVVSTGGLSDIPVRFYGSLDDPQRDVHAGAMILSAIGSLGTGVFDIIGGIFTAFFGLFK